MAQTVVDRAIQPRVAVLGCGHWGGNIVRTMHALRQAAGGLALVVDPSAAGRERAAKLAPGVPVVDDFRAAFDGSAIDAVMIATPAETHFDLACQAIDAGRDVFVEKPMTIIVEQAVELVERAERAERILMVGHLLEYHPAILKLQELIRAGELGKIRYVISNRLNLGKIRTEENALWSFAPHDIAVILRLVNATPFQVVATGGAYVTPNIADVTVTQLLFDNGVRSHIFVSWLHPFKEQKLVIVGSNKMASYDDVNKKLVLYDQRVDWNQGQPVPVKGEGVEVAFPADEPLMQECRHFIECVQTRRQPITDGPSGLRVLQILDAAQQSLITNGSPITIRREAASSNRAKPQAAPTITTVPARKTSEPAHSGATA